MEDSQAADLYRAQIQDAYHARVLFYPVADGDHGVLGEILEELLAATSRADPPARAKPKATGSAAKPSARQPKVTAAAGLKPPDVEAGTLREGEAPQDGETQHDVFLCHNTEDKAEVREIGRQLRDRGLRPWLDESELRPGLPWPEALEREIGRIGAVAIFVGKGGLGAWQRAELDGFLTTFVKRPGPVIPIILASCEEEPQLPPFLERRTWVDFRKKKPDPLEQLIWGVRGQKPEEEPPTYADGAIRDLGEALAAAQRRHEELTAYGEDASEALAEILKLRRQIRGGGQLHPGDFLADGRFRLLELIGKGGFSTVFKAYDRHTLQTVAVKVLHGQYARDATRRERFFRGARKMAELQHQGIVRVIEPKVEDDGYLFFVMEYVPGGDLRWAVLEGKVSREAGLEIIRGVAEALEFAHRRGVIHRDIKPANILLAEDGRPKLTDFDLVRAFDTTGGTRTGSVLGTFLYMAPEALELSKEAGVAAEVYSLAMTTAFVLYGRELPPLVFRDAEAFLKDLDCKSPIRTALIRAASWEPERRFASVHELVAAFATTEGPVDVERQPELKPLAQAPAVAGRDRFEPIRKALHETSKNLGKRSRVYEGIPKKLDDPEACLALVEQLKDNNRNGFDLYWLWWVVEEVERRWRVGDRGRELLGRFFDHIPAPEDLELLWSVETRRDGRVDLWRQIPAGESWIGSPQGEEGRHGDERRHRVEIVQPYWLAAVPVTNAQYAAFDPDKAARNWQGVPAEQLPTHPRVDITWYEAVSFCRWLSTLPGFEGCFPRLPVEEEWEVACRARTETRFWRGNAEKDLKAVGWFSGNAGGRTHRAGGKPANDFGLYDLHGNVWEWTLTPWDAKRYEGRGGQAHPVDPADPSADLAEPPRVQRVMRGGSCRDAALRCRSAFRNLRVPGFGFGFLGFRVLLSSAPSRP